MSQQATADRYDDIWNEAYGDMQEVGPTHRHMRRLLEPLLASIEYESALEVGCGAGHNVELLREHGARLIAGVDISEEALRRARSRAPEARFQRLDIERDGLDGEWDLVFSSLVLEHLPDDVAALAHMRPMTRRWLLLTTIAGDFHRYRAWDEQMGHVRNYRVGELEHKVRAAGFEVEQAIYWGFPFYSPLARMLQNGMTSEPRFGVASRVLAEIMYRLYFLNSRRRGDLLILLARV